MKLRTYALKKIQTTENKIESYVFDGNYVANAHCYSLSNHTLW